MDIYIVENYNSGEFTAFNSLENANKFVQNYYAEHFKEFIDGLNMSSSYDRDRIITDLKNLGAAVAFIEDVMYIHNCKGVY